MNEPVRILILEDRAADAELITRELRQGGLEFTAIRVETESQFREQLVNRRPDLVLSDYSLPHYDGLSALEVVSKLSPKVPFLLVSGTLGEEAAIEAFKHGATDYVMKACLSKLVPAVRRALNERNEHARRIKVEAELRQSEEFARNIIDSSLDMIVAADLEGRIVRFNPAAERTLGYDAKEILGQPGTRLYVDPADSERVGEALRATGRYEGEVRKRRKNGGILVTLLSASVLLDDAGRVIGSMGVCRDITERKRVEEELARRNAELERFNRASVGRELRMVELKQQVNELAAQLGQPRRYPLAFMDAAAEEIVRIRAHGE